VLVCACAWAEEARCYAVADFGVVGVAFGTFGPAVGGEEGWGEGVWECGPALVGGVFVEACSVVACP